NLFDGLAGMHEESVDRFAVAVKGLRIQNLIRLIFLLAILGLLLLSCQRQPLPTSTAVVVADTVASEEDRLTPAATTPVPSPTLVEPTVTASPSPTATPEAAATTTRTPTASLTATAAPLPLTEELTVEFVAHEGGSVRSVAVIGTIACVGVGPRL